MTRLYRLVVEYPIEAYYDGSVRYGLDPEWEPENWAELKPERWRDDGPFVWPREKIYYSRSGASARAALFEKYGATVQIIRSEPVVWESEPRVIARPQPEPEPVAVEDLGEPF